MGSSSFFCHRNLVLTLGAVLALFVFIGGTTVLTVLKISQHVSQRSLSSCMTELLGQNVMLVPVASWNNLTIDGKLKTSPSSDTVSIPENHPAGFGNSGNQSLAEAEKSEALPPVSKPEGDGEEDGGKDDESVAEVSKETQAAIEEDPPVEHYPFSVRKMHLDPAWREGLLPTDLSRWNGEHVFVISLEGGPNGGPALARMDAMLQRIDLKYTRAIAPRDMSMESLQTYAPIMPEGPLHASPGLEFPESEVRYTLAHLEVWWRMVNREIPFALVIEDDAPLSDDGLRQKMEAGFRELNMILGGGVDAFDFCVMIRKALVDYGEYYVTSRVRHAYASMGSAAYVVTLTGARKLLAAVRIDDPAGVALWKVPDMTSVALDPTLGGLPHECPPTCNRPIPLDSTASVGEGGLKSSIATIQLGNNKEDRKRMVEFVRQATSAGGGSTAVPGGELEGPGGVLRRKGRKFARDLSAWNTYVISMEKDLPRFEALSAKMEALGFGNVTHALAVDASNADIKTFAHLVTPDHRSRTRSSWGMDRSFLSRGEIGCGLSHYLVWRDVVRRRLPYAIVFEDDVDLLQGFRAGFERNVAQLETIAKNKRDLGFDVCFLGRQTILQSVYNPVLADNVVATAMSWCTYAYIISYEGAVRLTERFFMDDPIDSIWWRVPGARFWGFEPSLVGALSGTGGMYDSRTELGSTTDPFPGR